MQSAKNTSSVDLRKLKVSYHPLMQQSENQIVTKNGLLGACGWRSYSEAIESDGAGVPSFGRRLGAILSADGRAGRSGGAIAAGLSARRQDRCRSGGATVTGPTGGRHRRRAGEGHPMWPTSLFYRTFHIVDLTSDIIRSSDLSASTSTTNVGGGKRRDRMDSTRRSFSSRLISGLRATATVGVAINLTTRSGDPALVAEA